MPSIGPPRFKWEELPCTPWNQLRAFTIYVPTCETDQTKTLPSLGVTWSDSPAWIKNVEAITVPALKTYVLRMQTQAGEGRLFTYGPVLTQVDRDTPFRPPYHKRQQYYWPTVLSKLWFERHAVSGQEVILDRDKHRVGQTYPTVFETREYFSDVPWDKLKFSKLFPITDTVSWNMGSNKGSFPECLHPDCAFPSQQLTTTGSVMYGAGTVASDADIGYDLVQQQYPATPMTDWERYVVDVQTFSVLGMWHMIETWALPPIDDREVQT